MVSMKIIIWSHFKQTNSDLVVKNRTIFLKVK